jgi:di/tricarboxylate transporter
MHIDVSWGEWALAAVVPGLASLVLIPLLLYKIYPPQIKETPGASQLAKQKLAEMSEMHRDEWSCYIGDFVLLLLLWILGDQLAKIDSAWFEIRNSFCFVRESFPGLQFQAEILQPLRSSGQLNLPNPA